MDITTIFFDFDGVVADTEPLYDIFWRQVAEKYLQRLSPVIIR